MIEPQPAQSPGSASTALGGHAPSPPLLAPLWHTILLLALVLGISLVNLVTQHGASLHRGRSHMPSYLATIAFEWVLLALVLWGLRLHRTPLRQLLGVRRPSATEWLADNGIAGGFWFCSALALVAASLLLHFVHLDPQSVRRAATALAPQSPLELAVWIALSISAGICEECIFRGYLQQQFTALTRHAWLGFVLSAICFGLAHGYQGVSGILLITLYGAFFSLLVAFRGSLRAAMIAHAWQDTLSGLALYIAAHVLHRLPH